MFSELSVGMSMGSSRLVMVPMDERIDIEQTTGFALVASDRLSLPVSQIESSGELCSASLLRSVISSPGSTAICFVKLEF